MQKVIFENIHKTIIENLKKAENEIIIVVAWITDRSIFEVINTKVKQGVSVTIIAINDEINLNERQNVIAVISKNWFKELSSNGAKVFLMGKRGKNVLHHKYCIIDNDIVITGSYNWTYNARNNLENVLLIEGEEAVVKMYTHEYKRIVTTYFISRQDLFVNGNDWDWWNELNWKEQIAFYLNLELNKEYSKEPVLLDLRGNYFEKSVKEFYEMFCKKKIPNGKVMNEEILRQIINIEEIDWRGNNMSLTPLYHLKKLKKVEYFDIEGKEIKDFKKSNPNCILIDTLMWGN